ncbi:MAG: hypothetical protein ACRERU_15200 [Methylococcales bacterium]
MHIRIFDINGKIADKPETVLVNGETLSALKMRLNPFPDQSGLSTEQKQEIIEDVATLIGDHAIPRINQLIDKLNDLKVKLAKIFNQYILNNLKDFRDLKDTEGNPIEDKPLYDRSLFENSNLDTETKNELERYFSREMEDPETDIKCLTRLILENIFTPYLFKLKSQLGAQTESLDATNKKSDRPPVAVIIDTTNYFTSDDEISLEQLVDQIEEVKKNLTDLRQRMWQLRYECEMSIAEITSQENINLAPKKITQGTIRKRLFDLRIDLVFKLIILSLPVFLKDRISVMKIASKYNVASDDVKRCVKNEKIIRTLHILVFNHRRDDKYPPVKLVMKCLDVDMDQACWLIAFDTHHTLSKVVRSIFSGKINGAIIAHVLAIQKPYLRAIKEIISLMQQKVSVANWNGIESDLMKRFGVTDVEARLINTMYLMNQTRQTKMTRYKGLITRHREKNRYPSPDDIVKKLNVETVCAEILLECYRRAEEVAKDPLECLQRVTAGHASIIPSDS